MTPQELVTQWQQWCVDNQCDVNPFCTSATNKLVEMIEEHDSQTSDDLKLPVINIEMFGVQTNITKQVTDLIIKNNPKYKNVVWICEDKIKEPT